MKEKYLLIKTIRSNKGTTPIVIICSILIIVVAAAFITDIGYAAFERFKLAHSVKRVAAEGAHTLLYGEEQAYNIMKFTSLREVNNLSDLDIKISDNNKEISVFMQKPFKYMFLSLIGYKGKELRAAATLRISGIKSVKGARPFAIERQLLEYDKYYVFSIVTSKQNELDTLPKMALLDLGKGYVESNILYGYRNRLKLNDSVYAFTGGFIENVPETLLKLIAKCKHVPECSIDSHAPDCAKIIILTLVDSLDATGQKAMNISGFAAFFIEKVVNEGESINIEGRFIRKIAEGETSDEIDDFGLMGINIAKQF